MNPPADGVVRRIFDMALAGRSTLDVAKTLNAEGIPTANGKKWLKTTIHVILTNEAYAGTVVWGANAKNGAPPCVWRTHTPPSSPNGSSGASPG